jgi:hypothetical protein
MAEYGICENQQCELCYANFQDLLGWLDGHPADNQRPPDDYLSVFQEFHKAAYCANCQTPLIRTTQPKKPPLANRFIEIIDILRGRGVLAWP